MSHGETQHVRNYAPAKAETVSPCTTVILGFILSRTEESFKMSSPVNRLSSMVCLGATSRNSHGVNSEMWDLERSACWPVKIRETSHPSSLKLKKRGLSFMSSGLVPATKDINFLPTTLLSFRRSQKGLPLPHHRPHKLPQMAHRVSRRSRSS